MRRYTAAILVPSSDASGMVITKEVFDADDVDMDSCDCGFAEDDPGGDSCKRVHYFNFLINKPEDEDKQITVAAIPFDRLLFVTSVQK